jgi:hypothetical protein
MLRGFDAYSVPARVLPVLVVFLPPLVLLGGGVVSGARGGIVSGAVLVVVGGLSAQLGRDRGKRLEPALWQGWGGSPTLRRLRFAGAADAAVVARLHGRVECALGDALPTREEETSAPADADARYDEATRRLISMTRDRERFGLLFAENVNYGMRRNLLGLRTIGISVAGTTLVVAGLLIAFAAGTLADRAARYAPAGVVAMAELVVWLAVVNPGWVKVPAEAYADRLMETVDQLDPAE